MLGFPLSFGANRPALRGKRRGAGVKPPLSIPSGQSGGPESVGRASRPRVRASKTPDSLACGNTIPPKFTLRSVSLCANPVRCVPAHLVFFNKTGYFQKNVIFLLFSACGYFELCLNTASPKRTTRTVARLWWRDGEVGCGNAVMLSGCKAFGSLIVSARWIICVFAL
jgi:hypothetical protein